MSERRIKDERSQNERRERRRRKPRSNATCWSPGAGSAGLSAAHAFAAQGRKVIVVGKVETHLAGRTVALFEGSLRFYRALGLWERLRRSCRPDGGDPHDRRHRLDLPDPPKEFRSREIDLDAFGENIENNALVAELAEAAKRQTRTSPWSRT